MSGVPILTNVASGYRMLVEIAWVWDPATDSSGWTWTDVTTDVWQPGNVTITIGRANESAVAQPGNCSLRLKNPVGAYTPTNPASVNYPNVVLGVPLRVSVSVNGGSTWRVRFLGYVSSWAPGWDAQGKFAYVAVTASGITRRLGAGSKPLRSALERAIVAEGPLEYWPLEDGSSAAEISSGLSGHPSATVTGVTFASESTLVGSAPLPVFTASGSIAGRVSTSPSASQWQWDWHYFMPGDPGADTVVMEITTSGTVVTWHYLVLSGGTTYSIKGYDTSGTLTVDRSFATLTSDPVSGAWVHFSFYVQDAGSGTVNYAFHYYPSLGGIGLADGGSYSGSPGQPTSWAVPASAGLNGTAFGHVVLYDAYNYTQPGLPAFGYVGETVDDRLYRLCITEEGIPLNRIGTSVTPMGPQSLDTLMNLLRECETTDGGVLFDGLQQDLTYVSRNNLYNQAADVTINANSGQVPASPGPLPVFDDQRILNRITVTRTNGSSAVYEDVNGVLGTAVVGVRDGRLVVNTALDNQLPDIARWRVHQGTANVMRYPQVLLDLAAAPEIASTWVATTVADRVDLTNLSSQLSQHPTGDVSLLIEGWTEVLSSRQWRAVVNTSPFRTWEAFEIADSRLGRIETDGSTLHQNYSTGATSLLVDSSGGLWSTSAAPFDVEIRGWQIHVTAVSGSSSPQTFTVTAIPGDLGGGNPVSLWRPGVLAL